MGARDGGWVMKIDRTLRTPAELEQAGLLPAAGRSDAERVAQRYAVAVTPAMAALMTPGDAADPIARQFVPDAAELVTLPAERADPIGDGAHSPTEGIVHRYPDRVLLKAVHVCPVYCRFCFRREVVGPQGAGTLSDAALEHALGYIAEHPEIWEVILTGGDPLVMSSRRLSRIAGALAEIDHVRVVRFHTRVPVAAPERVDDALVAALSKSGKPTYAAIHINHPRELTADARAAAARLADAGIVLLGQSVLLAGVNDSVEVLEALMRGLVECRIRPYYLHHPDLAPGTSHFRVPLARGRELVMALRGRVSGLCQPTYVLDIPGGFGKTPASAAMIEARGEGCYDVMDFRGERHSYQDSL